MTPATMAAVLLTGHGGIEKLEYREGVPVPEPGRGDVLIEVAAAGVNRGVVLQNRNRGSVERMTRWQHAPLFKGRHFPDDVIVSALWWYFRKAQGKDCRSL